VYKPLQLLSVRTNMLIRRKLLC